MTLRPMIKRLKDRVRPRWMKTLRRLVASRLRLRGVTRELGLAPLAGNPLAAAKSSDTLFILGSGSSINDMTEQEWQRIAAADSIGFNFWLVHDFVPKLYVFEPTDPGTSDHDCLMTNLRFRAGDYVDTPILLKDGERHKRAELCAFLREVPRELRRNLSLSWEWEPPDEEPAAFSASLRRLDRFGLLTHPRAFLVRKRASVFFLTLLGLRAGYKHIVLCGIDLNNTAYFYESRRQEYGDKGRAVPLARPLAAVHKTDDPDFGKLTISTALEILNEEVLKKHGVQLYVAFQSSRLHPMLPSYFGR